MTARTKTTEETPTRRALLESLEIDPAAMAKRWELLSPEAIGVLREWGRTELPAALAAIEAAAPELRGRPLDLRRPHRLLRVAPQSA